MCVCVCVCVVLLCVFQKIILFFLLEWMLKELTDGKRRGKESQGLEAVKVLNEMNFK